MSSTHTQGQLTATPILLLLLFLFYVFFFLLFFFLHYSHGILNFI